MTNWVEAVWSSSSCWFTKEARQGRPPHWLSIWVAHGLTCKYLSADVIFHIKIFLEHNSFYICKSIQDLKNFHGGTARNHIRDNQTRINTINLPIPHKPHQRSILHIWPVSAPVVETSYEPNTWTQISFHARLIFGWPVRLPVGKHPGWADQTPESVPCLDLFVNITCLTKMILVIAKCCPQFKGTPQQKSSKVKCISYQVQDSRSRQIPIF